MEKKEIASKVLNNSGYEIEDQYLLEVAMDYHDCIDLGEVGDSYWKLLESKKKIKDTYSNYANTSVGKMEHRKPNVIKAIDNHINLLKEYNSTIEDDKELANYKV